MASLLFGSLEEVLAKGEYDQGDKVQIDYDALFDLVEQAKKWQSVAYMISVAATDLTTEDLVNIVQRSTNQPPHPVLGGSDPFPAFVPCD
jgi:hypothetical protein